MKAIANMNISKRRVVEVIYAANVVRQELAGFTAKEVRSSMADVLNVPKSALAFVGGRRIGGGYRLRPNDHLEFVRKCGSKGANEARSCYDGSDRYETRRFYSELKPMGQIGLIAAELHKIQKSSSRAEKYQNEILRRDGTLSGLSYRQTAYDRKHARLEILCEILSADSCGMRWGWKTDPNRDAPANVLCIDLPNGQISIHSKKRYEGPDYHGEWDKSGASEERIVQFCQDVFDGGQDGRNQKQ